MPRAARIVIPGLPHHVTQRGVRSMAIFNDDQDRQFYLSLLAASCEKYNVEILTWCLMNNHVHFIAVPSCADGLAGAFGDAHKAYSWSFNQRVGARGFLFQGRFGSYVMDEGHLLGAARYILMNPVRAKMVKRPVDYGWSSARYHYGRRKSDPLIRDKSLMGLVPNWPGLMNDHNSDDEAEAVGSHIKTGRPAGSESFLSQVQKITGRDLTVGKRGWKKGRRRSKRQ